MIGDDAQRARRAFIALGVIRLTRDFLAQCNKALHKVAIIVGTLVLHDRGHALKTHAGIKVAMRKLGHRTVFLAIKLRKHKIPELEEAIAVAARGAIGLAAPYFLALIKIDLGARAARTGGACRPEVIVLAQTGNMILGNTKRAPNVMGLVVIGKDSEIQTIERKLEDVSDELEGPRACLLLGDAAKRKITKHLEEGEVAAILADDIDIIGAHALLTRASTDLLHGLLALVILLELVHTRIGKQQRGIIGHQARRRIELKPALLKELKES